jgi:hypothetical protein
MSSRLTAPARSPLRRSLHGSKNFSPVNRRECSPVATSNHSKPVADAESDKLRQQAEAVDHDLEFEIGHLSSTFQKFWQVRVCCFCDLSLSSVARLKTYFFSQREGGFSPRSRKLSGVVPQPHSKACAAIDKLQAVRREVRITLEQSRHVKELLGGLLQSRFQQLPDDKVPLDGAVATCEHLLIPLCFPDE